MPEDIAEFAGPWRLEKRITDRRGPGGRFSGTARLTPQAGGLWRYAEAGRLALGAGPDLPAERRYLWRAAAGGAAIAFEDGRPFHLLPFAGGTAVHDCPPDRYDVAYDFAGWPQLWTARWQVTGPRKAYEMHCEYRR